MQIQISELPGSIAESTHLAFRGLFFDPPQIS